MKVLNYNLKRRMIVVGVVVWVLLSLMGGVSWAINLRDLLSGGEKVSSTEPVDYAYNLTVINKTKFYIWVTHIETQGQIRHVYDPDELQGIPPGKPATVNFWEKGVMVGTKDQNDAWYHISDTPKKEDAVREHKSFRNRMNDPRNDPEWRPFGSPGTTFVFSIEHKLRGLTFKSTYEARIASSEYIVTITQQ